MTGGIAFVLKGQSFEHNLNNESVVTLNQMTAYWEAVLKGLIEDHAKETGSRWAGMLLSNWDTRKDQFVQVVPKEMLDKLEHPVFDETNSNAQQEAASA